MINQEKIAERVGLRLDDLGLSKAEVSRQLGLDTPQTFSNWIRRNSIPKEHLLTLSALLGVKAEWLQKGVGPMLSEDNNIENGPSSRGSLPLISWVQAGSWQEAIDPFQPGDAEGWYPCPVNHSEQSYILRVRGASMEPEYRDGDLIFVDPNIQPEHNQDVVVRLSNAGETTFKRYQIDGNTHYLLALNNNFPNPIIPLNDEAQICGVVIFSGKPRT